MKVTKGGVYLKAKDVKDGETIQFLDAGEWRPSPFKNKDGTDQADQLIFKIKYNNDDKEIKVSKASRVSLIDAFGDDTENWVGKSAKMFVLPTPDGAHQMIVLKAVPVEGGEVAWDE